MNKFRRTVSLIFEYIVSVPLVLISGYLFVTALLVRADLVIDTVSEKTYYVKNNVFVSVIAVSIILLLLAVLSGWLKKVSEKVLLRILIIYTFIVGIGIAVLLNSIPGADQSSVLYAAHCFTTGDFRMLQYNWYLGFYPFQLPLVMLDEGLFYIFGDNIVFFWFFFNAVLICAAQCLIYKIITCTVRDVSERRFILLLLFCDFPLLLYVTFVYGTIVSFALSLGAIYLLIKPGKKKILNVLAASALMAMACLLRNNSLIIYIAVSIYCFWEFIRKNRKLLLFIPVTIVLFVAARSGIYGLYEARSGIEISEGVPKELHIATGLSENDTRANGWYNTYTYDKYIELEFDNEAAKEFGRDEIRRSLNKFSESCSYTVSFFHDKIKSTWVNSDFQGLWNNEHHGQYWFLLHFVDNLYHGNLHPFVETILNWFVVIVYGGLFMYVVRKIYTIRRRDGESENIFLIIFLGGFFFHLLWETKAQYVIIYYALLFPYAAIGWCRLIAFFKVKLKKK